MNLIFQHLYYIIVYPAIILGVLLERYFYKNEPVSKITEYLFQGRYPFFNRDLTRVKNMRINTVIDLTKEFPWINQKKFYKLNNISYFNFPTTDWWLVSESNLAEILNIFKESCEKQRKVLIHCAMWSGRSWTTSIYCLSHFYNLSFEEAYAFLKEKRTLVDLGFNQELYLKKILKSSSEIK